MAFKDLPKAARIFLISLFAVAILVLFLIGFKNFSFTVIKGKFYIFLFLLIFISFSDLFRVEFTLVNSDKAAISLSLPATFASIFIFNPLFAALISSLGSIVGDILSRREWFKTMFNFSQYVITVGISSLAYNFIISLEGKENSLLTGFSAVTVAGLVYFLLNSFLVSTITALVSKSRILDTFLFMFRRNEILLQFLSMFILGGLFAYILKTEPLAMILLIPLFISVYYSFKRLSETEEAAKNFMEVIAGIVDDFDKYTKEHSENVARICEKVANEMKIDLVAKRKLIMAAKVHDFGKIAVPQKILNKRGKLTKEEYEKIKEHPVIGAELMSKFPYLKEVSTIVKYHHKKLDGSGYPEDGVSRIPLEARILTVCDVYEALTSERPYRDAWTKEAAIRYLEENKSKFDQNVVMALKELFKRGEV